MPLIREATAQDAPYIVGLMEQLGYGATIDLIQAKLALLQESAQDIVLVATVNGIVSGVISLHITELFHAAGRIGRITSLVVDSGHREGGVGAALVSKADDYFLSKGCVRAEVTSGDHRPIAHAFYQAQGYVSDERRFIKRYNLTKSSSGPATPATEG